jgi:hypothetical protein
VEVAYFAVFYGVDERNVEQRAEFLKTDAGGLEIALFSIL